MSDDPVSLHPVSPHSGTHVPVLAEEVIHALAPVDGAVMVDGTYGGGGYARARRWPSPTSH